MVQTTAHPLVDAYRRRLVSAARRLPRRDRRELLDALEEHLAAGAHEGASEAEIRNMLEDLGDPEDIVEAAQPAAASRPGLLEVAAVVLLLVGAFFPPVVGWILGVALLWASPAWSVSQKWLGTLIVPGGLAAPLLLAWYGPSRMDCSIPTSPGAVPTGRVTDASVMCSAEPVLAGWPGVLMALVLVAASVLVAVHLLRMARRPHAHGT